MEHPSSLLKSLCLFVAVLSYIAFSHRPAPTEQEPVLAGRYHLRQHSSAASSAIMGRSGVHRPSNSFRDHRDHVSPVGHPYHQQRPQQMIATKPQDGVRS
jgi:hypothetical protein